MQGHSVGPKLRHETRQCAALLVGVISTVAQPAQAQTSCDLSADAAEHIPHGAVVVRPSRLADREVPIMTVSGGDIAPADTARTNQSPVAAPHSWTVQVASFESPEGAESLRRQLCGQGYDARIVGTRRPYSVRVGSFTSEQAAVAAARRVQSSLGAAATSGTYVTPATPPTK